MLGTVALTGSGSIEMIKGDVEHVTNIRSKDVGFGTKIRNNDVMEAECGEIENERETKKEGGDDISSESEKPRYN